MMVVVATSVPPNWPGPPSTERLPPQVATGTPPHASGAEAKVLLYAVEVVVRHSGEVEGLGDGDTDAVLVALVEVEGDGLQPTHSNARYKRMGPVQSASRHRKTDITPDHPPPLFMLNQPVRQPNLLPTHPRWPHPGVLTAPYALL